MIKDHSRLTVPEQSKRSGRDTLTYTVISQSSPPSCPDHVRAQFWQSSQTRN